MTEYLAPLAYTALGVYVVSLFVVLVRVWSKDRFLVYRDAIEEGDWIGFIGLTFLLLCPVLNTALAIMATWAFYEDRQR